MSASILPAAPERDSAWPEPLPAILSPTSITTFLSCPEQFRRVYLQGEWSRSSGALLIGGAESTAAERNFVYKRDVSGGQDMPLKDVEEQAADAFQTRLDTEEVEWEEKTGEGSPGEAKDTLIRLVRAGHEHEYPLVREPTLVEAEAVLQVDGMPPARAYVDVAEPHRVVSRKTASSKSMAGKKAAPSRSWLVQSAIESAALGLPTIWHVMVKDAKPRLVAGETDPAFAAFADPAHAMLFAATMVSTAARGMRGMLAEFGPDSFWPTPQAMHYAAKGDGGMSVCAYCAFRTQGCPAWL